MPGILRIKGTIELGQFWPSGESDADTTKIKVMVDSHSFAFATNGSSFRTTRVFEGAYSIGTGRHELIKNGKITVRLQGVDAPELHYNAPPLKTSPIVTDAKRKAYNEANRPKRRQYLAETATVALARRLGRGTKESVNCVFYSAVDEPAQVIDTYGRFVGDIVVRGGPKSSLNVWLVEQGWCYPTFYSSMSKREIKLFLNAMSKAGKKNVWKYYSRNAGKFEPGLVYRAKDADIDATSDRGPILMPKLFRRQVAYRMEKQAKVFSGTLLEFLKSRKDECYALQNFLQADVNTAETRVFSDFVKGTRLTIEPQEVVFREKPSTVKNKAGKPITSF